MEDYRLVAIKDNITYNSQQEFKGNPAWRMSNIERIEWKHLNQPIQINIEKGTLIRELISPDKKYLVLVFHENTQFPEPCNCVIYNLDGDVHKIVCAPFMVSKEVISYHMGDTKIRGKIFGVSNHKLDDTHEIMVLGVADTNEYYNTGSFYIEGRNLNPETGEIGGLNGVSLPLR